MLEKINLNYGWKFNEDFSQEMLSAVYDEANMQTVNLPHNVKDTPYNNFNERMYQLVSGYRKTVNIPSSLEGKRLILEFEAVGHFAEVYVNGKFAFSHKGGFAAFRGDIAGLVNFGQDNIIAVKVDSREREEIPPFGNVIDFLCYGGIYREAYIYVHNNDYISSVKVTPIDIMTAPKVQIDLGFAEDFAGSADCVITNADAEIARFSIKKTGKTGKHLQTINNAKLWDIDSPNMYTVTINYNGEVTKQKFGIREAKFTNKGFFLNGKLIKIVGLNRHQSYPYVGYAMPASAQRADADYLKMELGLNLARTSHYPNDKHFLNRCDEIGLMVFTEIPGWQFVSDNKEWRQLCLQNVREMIEDGYNHPSIIIWGVRINESKDDNELYTATNALAHQLDSSRQTGGVRCFPQSKLLEDVYTFNDFTHSGDNIGLMPKAIVCGNVPLLVTEHNGHMFPTKTFDHEKKRQEHLLRHAKVLDTTFKRKSTCGAIGWCMSDYNTHKDFGSGDKICYHGVSDMFRINKLAAYVYKAQQNKYPVLEVTSNMEIGDNAGGQVGSVYMITNCDSVKLYKNGNHINTFDINAMKAKSEFKHLANPPIELLDIIGNQIEKSDKYKFSKRAADSCKKFLLKVKRYGAVPAVIRSLPTVLWLLLRYKLNIDTITYMFGEFVTNWGDEANSYKLEGFMGDKSVVVEKASVNSTALEVIADSHSLVEGDTYDVTRIAVRGVSQTGTVMPYCNEVVTIKAEGCVEVIGDTAVALVGGQRGFWIKTIGKSGKAKVTVSSTTLGSVTLDFEVKKI